MTSSDSRTLTLKIWVDTRH